MSDNIERIIQERINTNVTLTLNKYQLGLIMDALQMEIAETEREMDQLEPGTADHDEKWQLRDDLDETLEDVTKAFKC